jgi:hypothetical protein
MSIIINALEYLLLGFIIAAMIIMVILMIVLLVQVFDELSRM